MIQPLSEHSRALITTGQRYFVPNYKPREMILDRGRGATLWDLDGNDYIDLGTGISVNSLGHQDPDIVAALTEQARKLWHTSNIYFNEPAVRLAEELVQAAPFAERVFFCNSGAEANEAAIKLARKWSSQRFGADKRRIITFKGSFHGRTLATVTATAQPKYQEGFEPLPGGFSYCPFNDIEALAGLMADDTCAVLVEPIQGEGGITPAKPGFLSQVRELCDRHQALLLLDEVQCGMGRTGRLFAHQWEEGLIPDVVTLAKAMGSGFPVGAMLTAPSVAEVLQFGSHGSTFGGNPLGCAVARVVLGKLRAPELMAHVERQGQVLRDRLDALNNTLNLFRELRGRGLMIGAELRPERAGKAGDMVEQARLHGVLILQAGPDVLRFLPPLNITDGELRTGLDRLEAALRAFLG